MKVEQIAIFVENKSGRLAEVTDILAKTGVNIRALSLADTADFGILRLIVNDTEKAKKVLKENGFTVRMNEVVAVEVPDRPGGLAGILGAPRLSLNPPAPSPTHECPEGAPGVLRCTLLDAALAKSFCNG